MSKTYQLKQKEIKREWHLMDAKGQILGRLSTQIATKLIGKHKKNYVSYLDIGDYVVVINASSVSVTGNKEEQKTYYRHSGYPGGLKETKLKDLRVKSPTKIIEHAVSNMLPKNRLRDDRMRRLKVFAEDKHPYGDKLNK